MLRCNKISIFSDSCFQVIAHNNKHIGFNLFINLRQCINNGSIVECSIIFKSITDFRQFCKVFCFNLICHQYRCTICCNIQNIGVLHHFHIIISKCLLITLYCIFCRCKCNRTFGCIFCTLGKLFHCARIGILIDYLFQPCTLCKRKICCHQGTCIKFCIH